MFVTSQGSPTARLRRALATRNPAIALAAAAEVERVPLADALALCRLLAESGDPRFSRASGRLLVRYAAETGATLAEVQLAAAALARLGENPADELARRTLEDLAA